MNRFGLLLTVDTCLRSDAEFSGLRHSHIDKAPKSGQLRVLREGGGMVNEKRATVCCARDSFKMERFVYFWFLLREVSLCRGKTF